MWQAATADCLDRRPGPGPGPVTQGGQWTGRIPGGGEGGGRGIKPGGGTSEVKMPRPMQASRGFGQWERQG